MSGSSRWIVALLGRPGSGKSSAGEAVAEASGAELLQAGEALRDEVERGTELGREVEDAVEGGELVPTELVLRVLGGRGREVDSPVLVLDGFPRREDQIEALDGLAEELERELSLVAVLALPRSMAQKRLTGRRVCSRCGAVYNVHFDPPEEAGVCDRCGGELVRREDDRPEVVRSREERFDRTTKKVVRWYSAHRPDRLRCIRAGGPPEAVQAALQRALHETHPSHVPQPVNLDTGDAR